MYTALGLAATLALLGLGVLDYLRGEARVEAVLAVYALLVLSILAYPAPLAVRAVFAAAGVAMTVLILVLVRAGQVGLMDIVVGPGTAHLALHATPASLVAGAAAALVALAVHQARAARLLCDRSLRGLLVPGTVVRARGPLAARAWYMFPVGLHSEAPDEELHRIKSGWRKKECVTARNVIPLVWVYAVFHSTAHLLALYLG